MRHALKIKLLRIVILFGLLNFVTNANVYSQNQEIENIIKQVETVHDTEKVVLYNKLGVLHWYIDISRAEEYTNQALNLSRKINYLKGSPSALNNLGIIEEIKGNLNKSELHMLKSAEIWKSMKNVKKAAEVYDNLGLVYGSMGLWTKGLRYSLLSLSEWEKTGKIMKIAPTKSNIGLLYQAMGNDSTANRYFRESLDLFFESGKDSLIVPALLNLAVSEMRHKNIDSARKLVRDASLRNDRLKNEFLHYNILVVEADLELEIKNFAKARRLYFEALNYFERTRNVFDRNALVLKIAHMYKKQGNTGDAVRYFKLGIDYMREINDKPSLSQAYRELSEYYEQIDDYRSAYDFNKKFQALSDTLFSYAKLSDFNELQVKFETEKKEKEIAELSHKNLIFVNEIQKQRYQRNLILSGFAVLLILVVIGIFIFQKRREYQEQIKIEKSKKIISEMRLKLLLTQINPHFYFNTLNNIYARMIEENSSEQLKEMILKFSDLMRFLVENADSERVSLATAIAFTEDYIFFEKIRFGERCLVNYAKDIENPEALVAYAVFFPMVENAFKYGADAGKEFEIDIAFKEKSDTMTIFIKNKFSGNQSKISTKKGISIIRESLDILYPNKYRLDIQKNETHFSVELYLDLR